MSEKDRELSKAGLIHRLNKCRAALTESNKSTRRAWDELKTARMTIAAQAEEIKRLRDILTDLIASHAWYTAREYKRDVSYNSDSPGYEEEEKALEIYREIFGEDQFEHLLNVCAALDQRRKPNG